MDNNCCSGWDRMVLILSHVGSVSDLFVGMVDDPALGGLGAGIVDSREQVSGENLIDGAVVLLPLPPSPMAWTNARASPSNFSGKFKRPMHNGRS